MSELFLMKLGFRVSSCCLQTDSPMETGNVMLGECANLGWSLPLLYSRDHWQPQKVGKRALYPMIDKKGGPLSLYAMFKVL